MKKIFLNSLLKIPFLDYYYLGNITIFTLHRVHTHEPNKLFPNENMKVTPEFLKKFIVESKSNGYEFISLDRTHEILMNQEDVKKKVVFTLDDGYRDNFEVAYPLFKKYNIPFTIYLTTSFPDKKALLWWYVLEDLILENDRLIFDDEIFVSKTIKEKNQLFLKIREIILKLNQKELKSELSRVFKNYEIDWYSKNSELCMSWHNITEISTDPLCTIGGHTLNHYVFNNLSKDEIIDEIAEANSKIEEKTGQKVEHFAYPFGSRDEVGECEFSIVKEFGFKTVTTTRNGNVYLAHRDFSNCCLPRVMLTEDFDMKSLGRIKRKRIVTV